VITALELARLASQAATEKKAINLRLLDLSGVSDLADYVIVMSGSTPPHLKAIFREIDSQLKAAGVTCPHKCGDPEYGWIVMDYLSVVIHIFQPRTRQYYAIEELWAGASAIQ
jgi:ribosome-associated protein